MTRPRVIIESPYAGDVERNLIYLKRAILDSISRGEAPFASHLFYTQVLDDTIAEERRIGMECGFSWIEVSDFTICYTDYGISNGMQAGIDLAKKHQRVVYYRSIGPNEAKR